jgi:uncharacterized protein YyaL (SSP411 family)
LAARQPRVRPGRDDKVIVAWNGLMIDAMARAGAALVEPRYVDAARKAADFILSEMLTVDGRLLHTWRAGTAKLDAYLDDYAALANALVSVYEATFREAYLERAAKLIDVLLEKFVDPNDGGFFFTASDHETLIARTKELTDSSTPSGNALAATALVRLSKLLGRRDYADAAEKTLTAAAPVMGRAPMAAGQMLLALDHYLGPAFELVLVGDSSSSEGRAATGLLQGRFLPRCVIAARDAESAGRPDPSTQMDELFSGKHSSDGLPVLYVCQDFACREPAVSLAAMEQQLADIAQAQDSKSSQ